MFDAQASFFVVVGWLLLRNLSCQSDFSTGPGGLFAGAGFVAGAASRTPKLYIF